jgi:hypothetical protein
MAVLLIAALALVFIGPAAVRGLTAPSGADAAHAAMPAMSMDTSAGTVEAAKISRLDFNNGMRKLWEQHVMWTRLYIISVAHDLPDQNLTAQRLLQNQVDIGNAVKPFYGEDAGNQLTALLKDHILIAAELLKDAKADDTAAFNDALARWYANANDIAGFLSSANPKSWPLDQMQSMMKAHLDLTLKEASDRLHGNYQADIQDYDAVENEILGMADMLTNGIIAQFPSKFN